MVDNERIIRELIKAWSRLDPEELSAHFADDGVYHDMPTGPVSGSDNVEKLIRGFTGPWAETTWDILHIMSSGNVVILAHLDRTRAADKFVDLSCAGVFELEGGKIRTWRDYFDFATYQRGLAVRQRILGGNRDEDRRGQEVNPCLSFGA